MYSDFEHIDSDDLDNALLLIEKSFAIKFYSDELQSIRTVNDLCNLTISKLQAVDSDKCTTQTAFYRLRQAIFHTSDVNIKITPATNLSEVLPKQSRRKAIKNIEENIGTKLYMLRPKQWVQNLLFILLLFCLLLMFLQPYYGIAGIIPTIVLTKIAYTYGNEFEFITMRELIKPKITYNYIHFRKDSDVNKSEINNVVITILKENTALIIK